MKLSNDVINAVLNKSGFNPVSVEEKSGLSIEKPFTKLTVSIYIEITQFRALIPDYIKSLKGCPLSIDIEMELNEIMSSAKLLCDDMRSLEFIPLWVEVSNGGYYGDHVPALTYKHRDEDVELAKYLTSVTDPKIQKAAMFWLLHFSDFMQFVRNTFSRLLEEAFTLLAQLQIVFCRRREMPTLKELQYRNETFKIQMRALDLTSLSSKLRYRVKDPSIHDARCYLKRIASFVNQDWQDGYVTCSHFSDGRYINQSTPCLLSLSKKNSQVRKFMNRLITDTRRGRAVDLLLADF